MKVGDAARLLEGIAQGLGDLSKKTADGLTALRAGMQPFTEQTVEQFVAFLRQCEEYSRTGIVSTGKKKAAPHVKSPALSVADAAVRVRALLAEINQGTVTTPRIDSLLGDLEKALKKPELEQLLAALAIAGKPKTKSQATDKIRQVLSSQLEMYVKSQAFETRILEGQP